MGNVSTLTRTPAGAHSTSVPITTGQTAPKKVENPAMATEIQSTKLQDVSTFMFNQLLAGEICRFGEGWITRCPECDYLIAMGDEFKTFGIKGKDIWRLAPSLSCPNDECGWHRSIVIEPEEDIDDTEDEEEAEEALADEEAVTASTGEGVEV